MSNLLEKASIVTTPTAYDNGKILSVKPSIVLGEELVVNGDFATNSDWGLQSGWSISGNSLIGTNVNIYTKAYQTLNAKANTYYQVTIDVEELGSSIYVFFQSTVGQQWKQITSVGVHTFQILSPIINSTLYIENADNSNPNIKVNSVSVKEQIDADFDFTRNSSATRVNSQGLIEDVQILSSNLVSNGDFSQEGSEQITNGNFATDSDWTKQTSWSISGGAANYDFLLDAKYIRQTLLSGGFVAGKSYKINFEITSGTAYMNVSSNGGGLISLNTYSVGSYSIYVTASASGSDLLIYGRNTSGTAFSIDNVSVKEVGQDWLFQNGWNMGDGVAVYNGTASAYRTIYQEDILTVSSKYRLTFDIVSIASGSIENVSQSSPTSYNTVGTKTEEFIATNTDLFLKPTTDANLSIDNISVVEITDDTNLPRIDYTGGEGHWLFEPQSTNLVYNSNDGFASANMNLVYNNAISPDGTQNAYKSTTTTASGAHVRTSNLAFAATSTFSVFLKYGNNQWYQIMSAGKTGNFVNVDIQNGVFGTNGADTENLSIKDFGNGWYRISGTFINAAATSTLRIYTGSSSSSNWAATSAPIGSYNYGYGFQVEASSFATSYIPTEGSIKTRLQDAAFGAGSSDLINSTEGVLYAEVAALADDGTTRIISLYEDGNINNRINIFYTSGSNKMKFVVKVNNSNVFIDTVTLSNILDYNKVALRYGANNFAIYINGVKESEQLSGSTYPSNTLDKLNFEQGSGNYYFYGKTKCLAIFKEALTDAELECLTTI